MNGGDRLRDALRASAAQPPPWSNGEWDAVRARAGRIRARRRNLGVALAALLVLGIGIGALLASGAFDHDASRSYIATPTPKPEPLPAGRPDIVVAQGDRIVEMSSATGRVVRTVASGLDAVGSVSVAPDSRTVYYSHGVRTCPDGRRVAAGIARVDVGGGVPEDVVGAADLPLVSPDGREMAYTGVMQSDQDACAQPPLFALFDLTRNVATYIAPADASTPLSWSSDSSRLLVLKDGDVYRITRGPPESDNGVNVTPGAPPVTSAVYTPDDKLLIARQEANTYVIQHFEPDPGGIDVRFNADGTSPTAMSFGTDDKLLLLGGDGTLAVQQGSVTPGGGTPGNSVVLVFPHVIARGVTGAAWLGDAAVAPVTTTTSTPSTTVEPTTTTTTGGGRRGWSYWSPVTSPPSSEISGAKALVVDRDGSIVFARAGSHQLWRRAPGGQFTLVAGTGYPASAGDHGPAVDVQLNDPVGLALGGDGTIYVADRAAHRVRAIAPDGIITTVAGTGAAGPSGDGGPATEAELGDLVAVAVAPNGDLYIADSDGIRRVSGGVITTFVAGGRQAQGGFQIDGRPVNLTPSAVAVATDGHVYVADFSPKALAEFDANGTVLRVWKDLYVSRGGLPADPDGGVLVAGYGFAIDRVHAGELTVVTRFSRGSVPGLAGTFRPTAVASGRDGSIDALDDGSSGGSAGALVRIASTGAIEVLAQ